MFGRHPRTPIEMEDVAEENGILELETHSSQILEEMVYDRAEMMNNVDQ